MLVFMRILSYLMFIVLLGRTFACNFPCPKFQVDDFFNQFVDQMVSEIKPALFAVSSTRQVSKILLVFGSSSITPKLMYEIRIHNRNADQQRPTPSLQYRQSVIRQLINLSSALPEKNLSHCKCFVFLRLPRSFSHDLLQPRPDWNPPYSKCSKIDVEIICGDADLQLESSTQDDFVWFHFSNPISPLKSV
eukprot:TRINITY_DN8893_c0_g1_i1.p1 TRINITY_DN8893_c0_g1~~TRINITY_DN8893_c0_g1_i1.p1  ORF type:complete len:191 (-),score=22.10 TRINITY_DN8893_c0_g1_i1:133-705(-)